MPSNVTPAHPDDLRLTYRRKHAITVAQLAALRDWTTKHAQTAVARSGVEPFHDEYGFVLGIDGRTPIYPRVELLKAIDKRPGRGRRAS